MSDSDLRHLFHANAENTLCGEPNNPWLTALNEFSVEELCPACVSSLAERPAADATENTKTMSHGFPINPAVLAMVQPGAKLRHWRGTLTDHPTSEVWHVRAVVDGDHVVCRVWRPGRGWSYFLESLYALHLAYEGGALEVAKGS